jgi:RNA recognition motif. (a.k.a. RRM, RBD, or RNP domain)
LHGVQLSPSSSLRAYVGGFGHGVSETELRDALTGVGVDVSHIHMVVNPATGGNRGFAFVALSLATPATTTAVNDALELVRTATVCGRRVTAQTIPEALARTH